MNHDFVLKTVVWPFVVYFFKSWLRPRAVSFTLTQSWQYLVLSIRQYNASISKMAMLFMSIAIILQLSKTLVKKETTPFYNLDVNRLILNSFNANYLKSCQRKWKECFNIVSNRIYPYCRNLIRFTLNTALSLFHMFFYNDYFLCNCEIK